VSTDGEDDRPRRALSFGGAAAEYDRLRPAPAPAALDHLLAAVPPDGTVLDLGAGTGLLTRALRGRGLGVVAVEPDPRMRAVLEEVTAGVSVREGTAEAVPLPDASVDAVLVASAWHWFDAERATREIARVLRPGGTFGLLWSYADPSTPWVHDLRAIAHPERVRPGNGGADRTIELPPDAPFAEGERSTFPRTGSMTRADLADMIMTYSHVLTLPADEQADVHARARALLATRPEPAHDDPVAVPFTTLVWSTTRD
jgi:SAM-dependent methyltransferase